MWTRVFGQYHGADVSAFLSCNILWSIGCGGGNYRRLEMVMEFLKQCCIQFNIFSGYIVIVFIYNQVKHVTRENVLFAYVLREQEMKSVQ